MSHDPKSPVGIGKTLEIHRSHMGFISGSSSKRRVQFVKQVTMVPRNPLDHEETFTSLDTVHTTVISDTVNS
jgi:hypothetical protein